MASTTGPGPSTASTSTSSTNNTQDEEKTVKDLLEQFTSMFPNCPSDYLEKKAKRYANNTVKIETFIDALMENGCNPLDESDDSSAGVQVKCSRCSTLQEADNLIGCPNEHGYCIECIKCSVKEAEQSGIYRIYCLICSDQFDASTLHRVLDKNEFSDWLRKKDLTEIKSANIPGLVNCPFCTYAVILDPPTVYDHFLKCQNTPNCGKISCRGCQKEVINGCSCNWSTTASGSFPTSQQPQPQNQPLQQPQPQPLQQSQPLQQPMKPAKLGKRTAKSSTKSPKKKKPAAANAPQTALSAPKAAPGTPQAAANAPQTAPSAPKAAPSTPQAAANAPQTAPSAPQAAPSTLQAAANAAKAKAKAKAAANAKKAAASAPQAPAPSFGMTLKRMSASPTGPPGPKYTYLIPGLAPAVSATTVVTPQKADCLSLSKLYPDKDIVRVNYLPERRIDVGDPLRPHYLEAERKFLFMKMQRRYPRLTIKSIDIVFNRTLDDKFEKKKEEFKKNKIPDTEILAFHDAPTNTIDSILRENLDPTKRRITYKSWGSGEFFSEHANITLKYGPNVGLILFRLLPGREYVGNDMTPPTGYQCKKVVINDRKQEGFKEGYGHILLFQNSDQYQPYCVYNFV